MALVVGGEVRFCSGGAAPNAPICHPGGRGLAPPPCMGLYYSYDYYYFYDDDDTTTAVPGGQGVGGAEGSGAVKGAPAVHTHPWDPPTATRVTSLTYKRSPDA